jgi:hypothetical protein
MRFRQITLSLTDLAALAKEKWWLPALGGVVCGCLFFLNSINHPISFTSQGIFNGHPFQTVSPWHKALGVLGTEELELLPSDHSLMNSYPVLEAVVKNLHLQATLTEKKRGSRLKEIFYRLKTEKAYRSLKKNQIPSQISHPAVLIPNRLVVPNSVHPLSCTDLYYPLEIALSLKIIFKSPSAFRVFEGRKEVGSGQLDTPFQFGNCSFTLSGEGKKGTIVYLNLIPVESAVKCLKKNLNITLNLENQNLTDVSFTHRNRFLAAEIVNSVMEHYQIFLEQEGKKKIKQQLSYLKQRQEEAFEQLDHLLLEQKAGFENDVQDGYMGSLQNEIQYVADMQTKKKEELENVKSELASLFRFLYKTTLTFEELTAHLEETRGNVVLEAFTLDTARSALKNHQNELGQVELKKELYAYCLSNLEEENFATNSLEEILPDHALHRHFEKIQELQHQLIDEKNWTEKERRQLREQLVVEKEFLRHHIGHLQMGNSLNEKILRKQIRALQESLLYLLLDRSKSLQKAVEALKKRASFFPNKWVKQQQIEIHTKLSKDMMEALTQVIEVKNIGSHSDSSTSILQRASPAILPNPPRLFRDMWLGMLVGSSTIFLGFLCYLFCRGPSGSYANCTACGLEALPLKDTVANLGLKLVKKGKIALLSSQKDISDLAPLITWLEYRGDRVYTLNLREIIKKEEQAPFLASERFTHLLDTLKDQYDRILIINLSKPNTWTTQLLNEHCDVAAYFVSEERLAELETLPKETFLVFEEREKKPVPLTTLRPLISKFLEQRFSSFPSVKEFFFRFSLKK